MKTLRALALMALAGSVVSFSAQAAPQTDWHHTAPEQLGLHEEIVYIPAKIHDEIYHLQTTVFRPSFTGRFPLIVLNHGSDDTKPGVEQGRFRPVFACEEWVKQGYAVAIPMRRGYAGSEGSVIHIRGSDMKSYGLENALDIKAAVGWLRSQEFVDPSRILIVGQSTGGLATLAYLSEADPGVVGGINFHGGMRPKNLEADPLLDARRDAFSAYARTTHVPSVWLYTANDHSSRPPFIRQLHADYEAAGGHAELHQLPSFQDDGHFLLVDPEGRGIWVPIVRQFLKLTH